MNAEDCVNVYIKHNEYLHERRCSDKANNVLEQHFLFWCPGCEEPHHFTISAHRRWKFDGNYEKPTFTPSLLYPSKPIRCHLFLTNGKINYLNDCDHSFKGKIIDMVSYDSNITGSSRSD